MRVIAIGGNPGSGKSTLMKRLIDHYTPEKKYDVVKLVPYLQNNNIYILGKYDEGEVFSGTDRMSMAVQPAAIKFLASLPSNSIVLYEGDRLFTASFLEDCSEKYDLNIIHLSTTADVREERYKERGSNQNITWLAGRESKISNILSNLTLMFYVQSFPNNNKQEQLEVYNKIVEIVNVDSFSV
jgi:broad-specificity NMP kinase